MLKQRIITALILLPIALCGFFLLEGAGFALFIGLVVTLGAWEWARLAGFEAQPARVAFALVVAVLLFGLHLFPDLAPWVLGASVLWWAVATYLVLTFPQSSVHWSTTATKLVIGLLILLPAWQGLVLIKAMALGNWLIMAVMVLVWGADIGAPISAPHTRTITAMISQLPSAIALISTRPCQAGSSINRPMTSLVAVVDQCTDDCGKVSTR